MADGDRINFRQGEGTFSTTLGWDARSNGNGFTLTFPAQGGLLGSNEFHSASNESVNAAIINLRQSIGQVRQQQAVYQQRANLTNEIIDSRNRIQHNLGIRPNVLSEMIKAKAEVAKAQREIDAANAEIAAKQLIADKDKSDADAADAVATTGDEHEKVGEMRAKVGSDLSDVGSARSDLASAKSDTYSAQNDLASAHRDLQHLDDRIAELRGIIRKDIALGGRP